MRLSTFVVLACTPLILCWPRLATADNATVIGVEAKDVDGPGGIKLCLLELVNRTANDRIENTTVTAYQDAKVIFQTKPRMLLPGQVVSSEHLMNNTSSCSTSGAFFRIRFARRNVHNDVLVSRPSITEPARALVGTPQSPVEVAVLTGIASLLAVIVGGWLGHNWTLSREREKDRLALHLKRFETYEPAIRKFLADWRSAPVATSLNALFDELSHQVIIEQHLVDYYHRTHGILTDPSASREAKQAAATDLSTRFADYIKRLDPAPHHGVTDEIARTSTRM